MTPTFSHTYPLGVIDNQNNTAIHVFASMCDVESLVAAYWLYFATRRQEAGAIPNQYINALNVEGQTPMELFFQTHDLSEKSVRKLYFVILMCSMGAKINMEKLNPAYRPIVSSLGKQSVPALEDVAKTMDKLKSKLGSGGLRKSFKNATADVTDSMKSILNRLGDGYSSPQLGGAELEDERQRNDSLMRHTRANFSGHEASERMPNFAWSEQVGGDSSDSDSFSDDDYGEEMEQWGGAHDDSSESSESSIDDDDWMNNSVGGASDDDEDSDSEFDDMMYGINLREDDHEPQMARRDPAVNQRYRDMLQKIMDVTGMSEEDAVAVRMMLKKYVQDKDEKLKKRDADAERAAAMEKLISKKGMDKLMKEYSLEKFQKMLKEYRTNSPRKSEPAKTTKTAARKTAPAKSTKMSRLQADLLDDDDEPLSVN